MKKLVDKLAKNNTLEKGELLNLLINMDGRISHYLHMKACRTVQAVYGHKIFLRGLIEFTNYCRNNCVYCGIRAENGLCERYRLTEQEILEICNNGYHLGYRTFVMQGGEDPYYNDARLTRLIKNIKERYPDCAVTLSIGERSSCSYRKLFDSGADRFLLRHETRSKSLYDRLHPGMSFAERERCLRDLKAIGFQTGAGFMVGLPSQELEDYVDDLLFLKDLQPQMVGIGPFIPHEDTPLGSAKPGLLELTCIMLSLTRLLLPEVLLPATTALGSLNPEGWEKGFNSGANVVMLNLSPPEFRKKYTLYNGKAAIPDESRLHLHLVHERIRKSGFIPEMGKGDHISLTSATPEC